VEISIARQCELIGLPRSTYYYQAQEENPLNQQVMRLIDEEYTRHPFYGVRRMTAWLQRQGYPVNHKRIRRLMRLMGLAAIYPKPRLSQVLQEHETFPYLLRELDIIRPNQVWCTDITYIRLIQGFVYLVVMMDWYSRYVLSWAMSTTMDTTFCVEALHRALDRATPEIFNSDQGPQFTSREFTEGLKEAGIAISMDGRGRVYDNIFIERLWRSVKYEEVYLHDYVTVRTARTRLGGYFDYYNTERPHQALEYNTPAEVYFKERVGKETNMIQGSLKRAP
jgi:putative transposase